MTKTPKKTGKKPGRKPSETKKPAKAAAAEKVAKIFNSELDQEEKALFLNHMPKIKRLREAVATATADLRNAYKKAKAEGAFEKADFDFAFDCETAEKEAKARAKIARQLKIAKIVGSDLGAQLDLFLEPVRTPASDRAYDEGRTAAMQNEAAKPKYDPSTEQFRKYMEGYHSVSAERVKGGIGKLHPEVAKDQAQQAAKADQRRAQQEKDAAAFDKQDAAGNGQADKPPAEPGTGEPTSGQPMTRAQFKQQQEEAARAAAGDTETAH